jgi:hypothetical protein
MKTSRHTVNLPNQMEQLVMERSRDFRSLSGYFVSLCFYDALYLPRRPIAKAFANSNWRQQNRAIENILTLRERGWEGANPQAVIQMEEVATKWLKRGDWLADHVEGELAYTRAVDLHRLSK